MIILDTNVISEPMRPLPERNVLAWIDHQPIGSLYMTAVNLAELMSGIERLPDGKRKQTLRSIAEEFIDRIFAFNILGFDTPAAFKLAEINKLAISRGFNVEFADCQIAAIASLHGCPVATRDEKPFRAMGIDVINPRTA